MVAWWRLYQLNGQSWGCPHPEYLSHAPLATPSASLASLTLPDIDGQGDTALGHSACIYNNNNNNNNNNNMGQQQKMLTLVLLSILFALYIINHQIFKYNQLQ